MLIKENAYKLFKIMKERNKKKNRNKDKSNNSIENSMKI